VVVNDGPDTVSVDSFRCELFRQGALISSAAWNRDLLDRGWAIQKQYFEKPGVRSSEESTFQFQRLLGDTIAFAPGPTLPPATAMYVMKQPFTLRVPPDLVRLTARGTSRGQTVQATMELQVVRHRSVNDYLFPLEGRWYVNAASSFQSHHRWRPAHEFALDFLRIGAGGQSYRGSGTRHEDYYAFGQNVLAAAEGTVVAVEIGFPETELPKIGETPNAYAERVLTPMWDKDPSGAIAGGNTIVLRHAGNEFSFYCHLQAGSVRVQKGDHVTRGQVIARVGMSGDGHQPHLHFQVGDGMDPSMSRGIPVVFSNLRPVAFASTIDTEGKRLLQTGEFVETVPPKR